MTDKTISEMVQELDAKFKGFEEFINYSSMSSGGSLTNNVDLENGIMHDFMFDQEKNLVFIFQGYSILFYEKSPHNHLGINETKETIERAYDYFITNKK